jgi:hypothetical protein
MGWVSYDPLPARRTLATARRLGERAGRRFVTSGAWPRNPFETPGLEPLPEVWSRGMLKAVGHARLSAN